MRLLAAIASRGSIASTLLVLSTSVCLGAEEVPSNGAALLKPFKQNLKAALVQGLEQGPAKAIEACRTEAPRISESLSVDGVIMGRSSHRLRNPGNSAPDWVAPIMASWVSEEAPRKPATVELSEGRAGYIEPITVQPLCLTCHGENLSPDVASSIAELYPEDQATGFAEGDLRGVFWVEYPTRD
jgi:hypothetical protein